uniref:Uncharacterized protein n=1 Tax=Anguilla anguilla TaxID=7936 RepID=A0A0E9VVY0_ANGAN
MRRTWCGRSWGGSSRKRPSFLWACTDCSWP